MRNFLKRISRDLFTLVSMVLLVGMTVAVLLVHLRNEFKIAQVGYEVAAETSKHRTLIEDHRRLKLEAALLGRTDHVSETARTHFKMQQAAPEKIEVVVESDPSIATLMR